jgi:hypothetical protein
MDRQDEALRADETGQLIAADKVQGTTVYNRAGDKLGTVDNVMIDKRSGHVAYAVMSFGGFLGIGDRYHPLPWSVLDYDTSKDGYVVDLDKETLKEAPSYAADELRERDWRDPRATAEWDREISDYYKVPPIRPV